METIEAFADETVFRNDENGYTVLVVKAGKSRVSAVGVMPPVTSGEKLRITGEWTEHPVYGRQIKVQSLEIEQPTTLSGIEKYLSSGMIRGVGPATAKLLIRAFGEKYPLTIEMGRFFAAPCGTFLTGVADAKCNLGVNYAVCDGGMHQVKYDGQLMGMQAPPLTLLRESADADEPWMLCGSLCTTADVLVREAQLPPLRVGDVIEVKESSRSSVAFKRLTAEDAPMVNVPKWLERDKNALKGTVVTMPAREDIDMPIEEHLIVELYSK